MIKKFAEMIGWMTIVFSILGILNIGSFRLTYQWDGVGNLNWQTNNFAVGKSISNFWRQVNR